LICVQTADTNAHTLAIVKKLTQIWANSGDFPELASLNDVAWLGVPASTDACREGAKPIKGLQVPVITQSLL